MEIDWVTITKMLAAALVMVPTAGAALGIGLMGYAAVQGISRNPDSSGEVQTTLILAVAFTEAIAIYSLVVALLILFVA
ncbi:MAG: ATP synthase F0 subunit C [Anaerolineaceae bacterium]|nr:ATP synthase F0 subunit C [Anaerolineaceae bacterium]